MNPIISKYLAQILHQILSIKKKHWVFASDYGNLYREGSKYLFEYMNNNHPEFCCTYIVKNPETYKEIKNKGYHVEMNSSLKGLKAIAEAEAIFTTQYINDLDFAYVKEGRRFYYLNHGQSLKKQMNALPKGYMEKVNEKRKQLKPPHKRKISHIERFLTRVINHLTGHPHLHQMCDVSFISATSEFFIPFLRKSYGDSMTIKTLGMPRNDALFKNDSIRKERWIDGISDKFVITYMPTHRMYGVGQLTPIPFLNNKAAQQWMRDNNIIFLMKQHPNMINNRVQPYNNDIIKDITAEGFDPQVVIYHTDVLISDYSSVWLDYLLLNRPLITYLYDDFENEDVGLNFDIRKETPGHLCYTEEDLFALIKKIKEDYDGMKPSNIIISKYHKYQDGRSCERYYNEIIKELGYK